MKNADPAADGEAEFGPCRAPPDGGFGGLLLAVPEMGRASLKRQFCGKKPLDRFGG